MRNQHTRNRKEENIQVEGCNALILKAPPKMCFLRIIFGEILFVTCVSATSFYCCIFVLFPLLHHIFLAHTTTTVPRESCTTIRWTFELLTRFLRLPLKYHWYWKHNYTVSRRQSCFASSIFCTSSLQHQTDKVVVKMCLKIAMKLSSL